MTSTIMSVRVAPAVGGDFDAVGMPIGKTQAA